jgi:hypothetical protein
VEHRERAGDFAARHFLPVHLMPQELGGGRGTQELQISGSAQ